MGVDVFEIVDSVGMRFSILNAVCMRTTYDQARIVRESSYIAGRVEPAGQILFVSTEELTTEEHLVRLLPRTV